MNESKFAAVVDRQQIVDVVYSVARGLDRCDAPILRSCFHDDARVDVGMFAGTANAFVDWVIPVLGTMQCTQHYICNVLVHLAGDTAASESYFLAQHVIHNGDGEHNMIAAGRYLDRFERRQENWRIVDRQSVYEWNRLDPSTSTWRAPTTSGPMLHGIRDRSDKSFTYLTASLGNIP